MSDERPTRAGSSEALESELGPLEALGLVLVCFTLLATLGSWLAQWHRAAGLGLAELFAVLVPSLLWLRLRGIPLRRGLGLRRPDGRNLIAAVLVGGGGFYLVAAVVEAAQEWIAPLPPAVKRQLHELILPPGGERPLLVDVVILAVLPALCEETLFRGVLLRSLRRFGPTAAVLGAGIFFGLFHGSPWRIAPTASLGILMGIVAWRARSLWPAVVVHLVNNLLVLVLVRAGHEEPPPASGRLGAVLTIAALILLATGLLMVRGPGGRWEETLVRRPDSR